MKKLAKFFLFAIVWLSFLWLSYAQDMENNAEYYSPTCLCGYSAIFSQELYFWLFMLVFILSLLIFPLFKIFRKSGQKSFHSLIPFRNLYTLSKITSNKVWRILFVWIYVLLIFYFLSLFIFGKPIREYIRQKYERGCCDAKEALNIVFYLIPLLLLICFFLAFICLSYHLPRKFGRKRFYSILFALFFPVWVRILSFGNYEYIGNKENTKNLES